jgi:hypothetical protein
VAASPASARMPHARCHSCRKRILAGCESAQIMGTPVYSGVPFILQRFSERLSITWLPRAFMNIRPSILLGGIALVVTLCALLWFSKKSQRTAVVANPPEAPAGPAEGSSASTESIVTAAQPAQPELPPPSSDVPIVLYGKLEDQASQPVAEADILGTRVFHRGAKRTARFSTKTDAEGRFQFEAGMGESLQVVPRKEGYALASTNTGFYGSSEPTGERRHPDPNAPVIIKMWKLQGAEPLAAFDSRFSLSLTQAPIYFDFVTQMLAPTNGDIKISLTQSPGVSSVAGQPDWRVEIETEEGGGLMPVTTNQWSTTYWAPTGGYERKQVLLASASAPNQWSEDMNALFFVQSRHGGVYTKLSFKAAIRPYPDAPVELVLSGVANTNGSCNWEDDPGTLK